MFRAVLFRVWGGSIGVVGVQKKSTGSKFRAEQPNVWDLLVPLAALRQDLSILPSCEEMALSKGR